MDQVIPRKAPELLETKRLHLRRPQHSDAQAVFRSYAGDDAVTRYLIWPTHQHVSDSYAFVEWADNEWATWPAGPYLVFERDGRSKKVIGSVGLSFRESARTNVGYAFARSAWGHGYATEALSAMIDLAESLGLDELEAYCHIDHAASARVLEKCDFMRQELLPNYFVFPNIDPSQHFDVLRYLRRIG